MKQALEYIDKNRQNFVDTLVTLLKFKSISADSEFKGDVQKCAEFVKSKFESLGLSSRIYPTKGHPIVYA